LNSGARDPSVESGHLRVNILGTAISATNLDQALLTIDRWVDVGERQYVCVCTVHTVMEGQRSDRLRRIVCSSGMSTPDGMPLVWLCRRAGNPSVGRVYGPDLMLAVLERSLSRRYRHFFYGGRDGVADELAQKMAERFPGLVVAGACSPPVGSVDRLGSPATIDVINRARPDIVWIGLGVPKQELLMASLRPLLEAPVLIGVGAAFDFHAGRAAQAPRWMMRNGLEWAFRLAHEPRRLARRYLINNPWFVYEVFCQSLGLKPYPLPEHE
jgi:N-acetylglucosaminyldiphosphoundecaprenol N-acetyl-beta-D-mannosaminyltransferase